MLPKISVIMPTYNRGDEIRRPIQSLALQSYADFELIVVNDGGESQADRLDEFSDIRIIYDELPTNSGAPQARNRAIELAQGKYITFLDDDDEVLPDHLKLLVHVLDSNPSCYVAYTNAYIQKLILQNDGSYIKLPREIFSDQGFNRDYLLVANYIHIANIMFRKECLQKSGLFDPALTTHQDLDLWIRLSRYYNFEHIPVATSIYYERDKGNSITINNPAKRLENLELLYRRYASYATPEIQYLQGKVLYNMYISYGLPVPSYLSMYKSVD